jgi:hypothetical protein
MRSCILALLLCALIPSARADFGFHAGSHLGVGEIGTHEPAQPQYSSGTFDLQAMPGWRFPNRLMAGIMADMRFTTQLEDTAPLGSRNNGGQGLTLGIGGTFETGRFKMLLSYDPWARHWVSGNNLTYRGSAFHVLFAYKFESQWGVDLQFVNARYNSVRDGAIDYGMGLSPIYHWNIGLGFCYSFDTSVASTR